ncbi:hypothetical protein HW555_006826 [Spodoptera exigua]|uniref:MADF domain-containing protein n=1 Tax=Spodoptera exigua TaxID=7107 RepID=A0A835GDV9_SPOEX|nr:hypothetical protein HW555_011557 [Spodoptera exigua]KAF9413383.1 hypothetical protein HW555_008365 [Spodoptera exigua]KAF9415555.1 hypothetical protein HW555_006826 [Spodoptera exigua]
MSCWSNEESLSFLEHYQMEPCIWNPKDANHKDKKKQADAWIRLAELTGRPVKEIKNKKEILMTTFRKHLKKNANLCVLAQVPKKYTIQLDQTEDDPLIRVSTPSRPPSRSPSRPPSIQAVTNKRRRPASETAEKQMAVAFGQLTNVLGQRQNENIPAHKDDDCDLYAKLLAIKLRELSTDERKIMMYQIDGLFINRISQKSNERHTPYPQYYSRPSSMAGAYSTPSPQVIPSRPTSVNSVYSEPIHNNQSFFPSPNTQTSYSAPDMTKHIPTPIAPAPSTSTAPSSSIRIISDQIINPTPRETNIINMAMLNAFEDFDSST